MSTTTAQLNPLESLEFEGVVSSLELAHDDGLADAYVKAIELATGPRSEAPATQTRVERILGKLHEHDGFISAALTHGAARIGAPELPQIYYSALKQVRGLVQIDS
jgi:hypothetical protein